MLYLWEDLDKDDKILLKDYGWCKTIRGTKSHSEFTDIRTWEDLEGIMLGVFEAPEFPFKLEGQWYKWGKPELLKNGVEDYYLCDKDGNYNYDKEYKEYFQQQGRYMIETWRNEKNYINIWIYDLTRCCDGERILFGDEEDYYGALPIALYDGCKDNLKNYSVGHVAVKDEDFENFYPHEDDNFNYDIRDFSHFKKIVKENLGLEINL